MVKGMTPTVIHSGICRELNNNLVTTNDNCKTEVSRQCRETSCSCIKSSKLDFSRCDDGGGRRRKTPPYPLVVNVSVFRLENRRAADTEFFVGMISRILEPCVTLQIHQLNFTRGPIAVLTDNQFGGVVIGCVHIFI